MAIKVINTSAIFALIWMGLYIIMWVIAIIMADDWFPVLPFDGFSASICEGFIVGSLGLAIWLPKCEILTHPVATLCLVCHFLIVFWDKLSKRN